MKVLEENGRFIIEHENGARASCETLEELHGVCHEVVLAMRTLLRRSIPDPHRAVPVGTLRGRVGGEKKSVRILIDPNTEYLGKIKEKRLTEKA